MTSVKRGEMTDFVSDMKDEFPGFVVRPRGERDEYAVASYFEPDKVQASLIGLDAFAMKDRREALERARDTGEMAITAKLEHVVPGEKGRGLGMFLPVYEIDAPRITVAERRKSLRGWVFTPVMAESLFEGLAADNPDIDVDLFDGPEVDEDKVLFDSREDNLERAIEGESAYQARRDLVVGGRPWTLLFSSTEDFEALEGYADILTAILGALLSLAVWVAVRMLGRGTSAPTRWPRK